MTKAKQKDAFVRMPMWWAAEAAKAMREPGMLVAAELLHRSWKAKSLTFPFPNGNLKKAWGEPKDKILEAPRARDGRADQGRAAARQDPVGGAGGSLKLLPQQPCSTVTPAAMYCYPSGHTVSFLSCLSSLSMSLKESREGMEDR
jgi:hypothetical protein